MGAINQSSAIYLGIADGKISRRVKTPTATSVTRETKEGKTIHEEFYRGWQGYITAISIRENDYGKQWQVTLTDDDGDAILQMPYSSGYSAAFLKCLPNVDFSKPVKVIPNMKVEGDKKKTTIFLEQDGHAIKWAYTKDNPNGIPQLKKVKVKGKETWDDSDIMEFLEDMVNREILPKLGSGAVANQQEQEDDPPF